MGCRSALRTKCSGTEHRKFEAEKLTGLQETPSPEPSNRPSRIDRRVDRVVDSLMAYGPEKIILFGSVARGDADEFSDIDLIIVKKTETRFIQRQVDATNLVPKDISVDIFVYTPEEFQNMIDEDNPFIERALAEGIVLYEDAPGNE